MNVRARRWRVQAALVAVPAFVLVGIGGYLFGVRSAENANWHTVTVDLASVAADEDGSSRLLSIREDGWTYALQNGVPWVDGKGVYWDSGWPTCLEPRHPGFMDRSHERVTFRFAEVAVRTGTVGHRQVVEVDCGSSAASRGQ